MTTVVAGGDSFVWGSELADSPHGGINGHSRKTFPALLSTEYHCAAYPGIGNAEIADRVRHFCRRNTPDIVVVCWTWSTRDNETDSDPHISALTTYLHDQLIPYLFTCADNCIVTGRLNYDNWYMFPPATEKWNTTAPRGFYQWAVENKYECGIQQHPLERAHQDAARLIQEKFNELVKKSVQ